jgi:hypothetical protein
MLINEQVLADVLVKTASALDIPDHVYEDAVLKYEEVGTWLAAQDSELSQYIPEITTVRLKVEENQLVDVFGEIGTLIEGLKGA